MICWSCEREAGAAAACAACGALQPPDGAADHFAVLDLPRRYDVDLADLERRYRDLSRRFHPDRFAKADPRARRASLQRTVQLNEARRTLADPVRRAEYLLSLAGAGGVTGGASEEVPPGLLMETLELREELGEARLAGDDAKVRRMRARVSEAMSIIAAGLGAGTAAGLEQAARTLVALRYYRRFVDEVIAHEESAAARAETQAEARPETAGSHAG
jgi:molecular chaperone HscB